MFRTYKSKNKTKISKNNVTKRKTTKNTNRNKTNKCFSFCKNDYVNNVNHGFKEYNNKRKKILFNQCKNIYCSDDCLEQYIKNIGKNEKNNALIQNYKIRLDNNFLTDMDERYTDFTKYKQKLMEKGATSSCLSLNKNYYNLLHK